MKPTIVTGAASGIGLAVVQRFLQEGYQVCGMSRRKQAPKRMGSLKTYGAVTEKIKTFIKGNLL